MGGLGSVHGGTEDVVAVSSTLPSSGDMGTVFLPPSFWLLSSFRFAGVENSTGFYPKVSRRVPISLDRSIRQLSRCVYGLQKQIAPLSFPRTR